MGCTLKLFLEWACASTFIVSDLSWEDEIYQHLMVMVKQHDWLNFVGRRHKINVIFYACIQYKIKRVLSEGRSVDAVVISLRHGSIYHGHPAMTDPGL